MILKLLACIATKENKGPKKKNLIFFMYVSQLIHPQKSIHFFHQSIATSNAQYQDNFINIDE
jgi:hypothetical protein